MFHTSLFLCNEKAKFANMKTKKTSKRKLPKGFKLNSDLSKKYLDQSLFKDKVERSNIILQTAGLPKI